MIFKYEIWMALLPSLKGSHVQNSYRPVVIVSNNSANKYSPVITVVPLTSRMRKHDLVTHVILNCDCLSTTSIALCEQVMALDKDRLSHCIGSVTSEADREAIQRSLMCQLAIAA